VKDVQARLIDVFRKIDPNRTSLFGDTAFRVVAKITSGPAAFTGRKVSLDLTISEFIAALPVETANRLRKELGDGEDDHHRDILPINGESRKGR
jgi:hypothetical protein